MLHFKDIYRLPEVNEPKAWHRFVNRVLAKLSVKAEVVPRPNHSMHMNTPEQRMNFYLLGMHVLLAELKGDWVEFGCFSGQSAMVFQKVLDAAASGKKLYVYDYFKFSFFLKGDVKQALIENFERNKLNMPEIVEGDFYETIPDRLPSVISLAHIDTGTGMYPEQHFKTFLFLLEHVYPRMPRGAVMFLSDYHDAGTTVRGFDSNPGAKKACDAFFKDKPEIVYTLYGNYYSHGLVIKK